MVILKGIRANYQDHARLLARYSTTASKLKYLPAIVFDIDGVLVQGEKVIEAGKRALRYLNGENKHGLRFPYIFMTNSGGVSEQDKALELSSKLEVPISAEQVVLSHSPMRRLAKQFENKPVLVVGGIGNRCADIARLYGFNRVITPQDIHFSNKHTYQFTSPLQPTFLSTAELDQLHSCSISAVLMLHDSYAFGRDLQIVFDALLAQNGKVSGRFSDLGIQSIPLFVSNRDLASFSSIFLYFSCTDYSVMQYF